ncbi:MAG: hypothetical protein HN929_06070 [Chloroflexi bacterium]|jgi:hypothetical protein|nr:hypothetical protein [Chloroflexota bacterium]
MDNFHTRFVNKDSETYYILVSPSIDGNDWIKIDPIVTDDFVYAPQGDIAVYTQEGLKSIPDMGTPFELMCLKCFYQITRKSNHIRRSILDGCYRLTIKPWRAPCETTALYSDDTNTYYLQGGANHTVRWRDSANKPSTEPPFVTCGALDANAGCWLTECPYNEYVDDNEEPFHLI